MLAAASPSGDGPANGPFIGLTRQSAAPALTQPRPTTLCRANAVEERFKSALDVLKETLHVPVARISLAEGGARALWFNSGSGTEDGECAPPPASTQQQFRRRY